MGIQHPLLIGCSTTLFISMFQITTLEEAHLQLSNVVQHLIIDEVWQSQPGNNNNTNTADENFQSLVINNTIIIAPADDTG